MPQKSKFHKGSSDFYSVFSMMRKDSYDGNIPSSTAPDPLLQSFIFNFPVADSLDDERSESSDQVSLADKISDQKVVECIEPSGSYEDQEGARRSEFAQELLLSTIFNYTS
ncbi:hypothetical protein Cni_G24596 [Canna indica]|uniref:Di19 C-terminal domain-containing protein n=1 Tax=Canna indica TaxID=4628 RepID=A0AAQ3KWG1_9LILI|nr:hypothetical protein Cni_G24596 [Canna indica]